MSKVTSKKSIKCNKHTQPIKLDDRVTSSKKAIYKTKTKELEIPHSFHALWAFIFPVPRP